ncbi:MAG TPA: amino acid adenylation domain-containing protein [Thermoanaerobaculia bacterium]|nr:amino acid adenylation domain-containing protein [Thermoanaerobaculia bacterium]
MTTENPPKRAAADLSPEKLSLLVMRMKKKAAETREAGRIPRRSGGEAPALSFAQLRLWLLDRLEPGNSAYNMPFPARLSGALDVGVLAWTLSEIVRRHESLRTTFATVDGTPVQVVAPWAPVALPVLDLSGLPPEATEGEARRLLAEDSRTPFDLETGPLLRTGLVRLSPAECFLLLNMHHIVSDGWSVGVFFNELSTLYDAFLSGKPSPLPELPIQYTDYAAWQREWLSGGVLEEQVDYWRNQLAGSPPALELPTDRMRPAIQTHRGAAVKAVLPADLTLALRELSRREGASMFMLLLSGFVLLLSRLAAQDEVVVGSPSAGRRRVETEGLIGLFLNTLVLRTNLAGDPTFRELLGRVKTVVLGAYRYQEVPFEKLLEELQPERQLSRSPFFQVLFNMVSVPEGRLELPGLKIESLPIPEPDSKFDFTFYLQEAGDAVHVNVVYNADLFDAVRMEEVVRQFEYVLAQGVANPDERTGAFSLVTTTAAAALPDPAFPQSDEWMGAVHQGLSRSAERFPGRPAVAGFQDGEVWTYRELDARSNQLAWFLRSKGLETGDVVALWAYRGASLPWAVMGALKAGGTFMILDPAYPSTRLIDYLRIGRPKALLAVEGAPPIPAEVEDVLLGLSCDVRLTLPPLGRAAAEGILAGQPTADPEVSVGPDNAAVLTFTSGSTGKPKGVIGRHGPLSHFHPWMGRRFGLSEADRIGMLSALSHDPLQRDLFTPLWFGATLVVPDAGKIGTHGYLAGWVRSAGVTVLHLTPAMMEMVTISAEDRPEGEREMPTLRLAFVVGDQLKKSDVERLQRLAPALSCVNLYGSTETQRSVSFFPVPRPESPAWGEIGREVLPLGKGMEDVQVLVLNGTRRLAGMGEAGEIYIRSQHLARGYLGDEALTAERFLTNPFAQPGSGAGDRIYRTGDLGRYLPDGTVEFAGRADFQVKIRGFRIELGEVEAALSRFPGVKECVVVVREDRPGDRRLAAYLVAETAPAARDLHAFLVQRLPEYMVPSAFVTLPALPLTQTGKVDRRALPAPADDGAAEAAVRELSPVEELLAGIWADLLGRGRVEPSGNFFELGGHSLLATRMLSRVRSALGVDLPLRSLFEEPTLEGMAALIERARREASGTQAPPIVPVPRDGAIPLSFAQQRLWFLDQLEPGSFAYNIAGGLRLTGTLDVSALARTLSEIVRRHESLRTTFGTGEDGEPVAVIAPPAPFDLPVHDLTHLPAEERERAALALATAEVQRPFDLARGPLFRLTLARLSETEHAMIVAMHHIVSDGWSIGILVRELGALYAAFTADRPSPLPELPVQYADYAAWQRQWLSGEVLEAQVRWWADHLAGAPPVLELPTDRPRPAVQTHRGGQVFLEIGAELSERLEATGRRLGVTPFMTLLGAFAVLLSRYSGQRDVVAGSPIANRNHEEVEDLIGFFANTLVLRTNLDAQGGDPLFSDLAAKVRETALGAYAHQDLPFERLVDELQPERNLSHSPVFQVMFALQNVPAQGLELPGLTLGPLPVESGRAQFELNLTMIPTDRGLISRIDYNADLFDAATAARMIGHYRHLLAGIAEDPARRTSALPLLSEIERHELLVGGNDTGAEIPGRTVHELFEATAARVPGSVAVTFEGQSLTYGELNARANRLAHHLRGLGAGPGALLGVCVERSLDMLVGLLGVLKAGGAYVPLDPSYPADRIAYVLEDGRIQVLLTQGSVLQGLPELRGVGARTVELDREDFSAESAENPASLAGPDDLAYVIYTSGSTGRPKGVEVRHGGAVNFLASMAREPGLAERDVMVAVTTISFDIAVLELYLPLSRGARVEIVSREVAVDGARLAELIASSGGTVLQATPATWRVLLEAEWKGAPGLKVLCGGEALPPDLARELLARVESLWNVYGPTETTVWSAVHRVDPAGAGGDGRRPVPIGRPIANTAVYLLDRSGEPVPPGAAGELYIGGAGLARGYLRRPDLTAERFVPDPFAGLYGEPGARLYRTGDLARYLPGSVLDFLGRADHQVKVRGFRIELGEIEAVLAENPAVQACAAVVREDVPGTKRLAAYYVAEGEAPAVADLRATLLAKLPDYMVPQVFVALPALPLTPNGKVDRRALANLPAPEGEGSASRDFVAPRDLVETILAEVWADVLRLDRVGIHDNFFELGGDSILTIQVVSRAKKRGVLLAPRHLFQSQTVAELARVADASALAGNGGSGAGPVPFTPGQILLLASEGIERANDAALFDLPPGVGAEAVEKVLAALTERHDALRLRFEKAEDGAWTQRIAAPGEVAILLGSIGAGEVAAARERFNPEAGPFQAFLVGSDRLLLVAHPLVMDAASWPLLLEDLAAAAEGRELPAATAPFRRFAEALAASSETAEPGRAASRLPVDFRGGEAANTEGSARTVSIAVPAEETRILLAEGTRRYGNTVEEVLLAALVRAVSGWTGLPRLTVDLAGSPRDGGVEELDGARTLGCLTWTRPLHLGHEANEGSLLKEVKETVRRGLRPGFEAGQPAPGLAFRFEDTAAAGAWKAELLAPVREASAARRHVLEASGFLAGESLRVDWTYSEALHRPETVQRLADRFLDALGTLLRHCQSSESGGFTPSDFPEAGLSQEDLDDLLADLA